MLNFDTEVPIHHMQFAKKKKLLRIYRLISNFSVKNTILHKWI